MKAGKIYATATEDMDALTFGSSILLRHMTFSEARKMPIQEIHLDRVLAELELSQNEVTIICSGENNLIINITIFFQFQFIDLCILLGCDYCDSIRGIGPKRAIELIKTHKTLEKVLEHIDTKKYTVPENWIYKQARELFINPEVADPATIEVGFK